jgi:hypothetical protein
VNAINLGLKANKGPSLGFPFSTFMNTIIEAPSLERRPSQNNENIGEINGGQSSITSYWTANAPDHPYKMSLSRKWLALVTVALGSLCV